MNNKISPHYLQNKKVKKNFVKDYEDKMYGVNMNNSFFEEGPNYLYEFLDYKAKKNPNIEIENNQHIIYDPNEGQVKFEHRHHHGRHIHHSTKKDNINSPSKNILASPNKNIDNLSKEIASIDKDFNLASIENEIDINNINNSKDKISIKYNEDDRMEQIVEKFNIKNAIKKNPFFFELKSPRHREQDIENNEIVEAVEAQTDNNKDYKDNIIDPNELAESEQDKSIERIKNKKNLNLFNYEEMEDLIYYKNYKKIKRQAVLTEEDRNQILERIKNKNNIINNHVNVIKPQIIASQKQINFENTNNKLNYMYLMMKKHQDNKKVVDKAEIDFKIQNFNNLVGKIKDQKYIEKLEHGITDYQAEIENLEKNLRNRNDLYSDNDARLKAIENMDLNYKRLNDRIKRVEFETKAKEEVIMEAQEQAEGELEAARVANKIINITAKLKKREKHISCCEKITNFLLGDPLRSYAKQKRIWGSEEEGAFDKEFQDHRIYFASK